MSILLHFTPATRKGDTSVDISKIKQLRPNDEGWCSIILNNGITVETRDPIHLVETKLNYLLKQAKKNE